MKRIVLIGDRICAGYLPVLRNILKDVAEIWDPDRPVCSTVEVLGELREWVLKRQPDYVIIASGILDTREVCFGCDERITPLKAFERNVGCILSTVLERSTTIPIWVTITPVDRRHVVDEEEFGYDNETISLYNEEAKAVARRLDVATFDLYGIVKAASRADSWRPDGFCFDERGSDFIAEKLAAFLKSLCAK